MVDDLTTLHITRRGIGLGDAGCWACQGVQVLGSSALFLLEERIAA